MAFFGIFDRIIFYSSNVTHCQMMVCLYDFFKVQEIKGIKLIKQTAIESP